MTSHREDIIIGINAFICQQIIEDASFSIEQSSNLLEMGILDSLAMIRLFDFTNKNFQVSIPDAELTPENFESIDAIADIICQYKLEVSA